MGIYGSRAVTLATTQAIKENNNPFDAIFWLRSVAHLETDIVLESKAKDLSLIRLHNDLARFAPDLLAHYGITSAQAAENVTEIVSPEEEALEAEAS